MEETKQIITEEHNITSFVPVKLPSKATLFLKRAFDVCSSLGVILLLLPFFAIFTIVVAVAMGGNPFFCQERPGKNNKIFKLIKYRSMTNQKDEKGILLADEVRLTKFGKKMRSLSIDELPELFNILVGDMSVVGPRPLLVRYIARYDAFQSQRMLVRPGLTGLAQISGRNAITWQEKFEKDVEYIGKMSFIYDLSIIFKTVGKILKKEGISQDSQATMEEFFGNANEPELRVAATEDIKESAGEV